MNYVSQNFLGEAINGTLEWNGRQLVAVNQGNKRYEYSYNSDGLRTSVKTYLNNALESIQYYIWQNGKLMGYFNEDKIGSNDTSVKMLYDNNDDLIGFRLVNEQIDYDKVLFFRKNLQGDIQSVYDSFGNQVLTYTYDAWGNVSLTANTDSTQSSISASMALEYVPITYRGYLYDANTGLYYLQSRYYNPTYGRFLNADSIMKTGEPLGANIFAYCVNNPVNYVDYEGRDALSVITNILYLLVVVAVMEADKLLDDFGYIFESATSFSYKETTINGITDLVATFVINSDAEEFESYDINIKLAHIDTWRDWQRGIEHSSKDNHFVDIFVSTAFFLIGFLGFPGQLLSASLSIFEIYYYIEQVSTYEYIDFIHEKIEYAKYNNLEFIYFVREIKRNYINFFGNLKSETKYDCIEG